MTNTKNSLPYTLSNSLISIILVTHNDADIIKDCIINISKALSKHDFFEIIVIDNASTDGTIDTLISIKADVSQLRVVCLSKKYDIPTALTAGFDGCVGDYIVALNIYLDSIDVIEPILKKLKTHDIVIGKNTHPNYNRQAKGVGITKKLIDFVLNKHTLPDPGIYLSGFSRNAIASITRVRRKNRYQEYISRLIGFRKDVYTNSLPPPYADRFKPMSWLNYIWYVTDASISNSFRPLRLVTVLGFVASFVNFSFLLYVFAITLVKKNITEGWITTSVIMGSMFFVLFIILTVISEYLLRILQETRDEPLYFVSREFDSVSLSKDPEKLNVEHKNSI